MLLLEGGFARRPRGAARSEWLLERAAAAALLRRPPLTPAHFLPKTCKNSWAEKINGRACMMGFIALLIVEGATGVPFLQTLGFTVGKGLGFSL